MVLPPVTLNDGYKDYQFEIVTFQDEFKPVGLNVLETWVIGNPEAKARNVMRSLELS